MTVRFTDLKIKAGIPHEVQYVPTIALLLYWTLYHETKLSLLKNRRSISIYLHCDDGTYFIEASGFDIIQVFQDLFYFFWIARGVVSWEAKIDFPKILAFLLTLLYNHFL